MTTQHVSRISAVAAVLVLALGGCSSDGPEQEQPVADTTESSDDGPVVPADVNVPSGAGDLTVVLLSASDDRATLLTMRRDVDDDDEVTLRVGDEVETLGFTVGLVRTSDDFALLTVTDPDGRRLGTVVEAG